MAPYVVLTQFRKQVHVQCSIQLSVTVQEQCSTSVIISSVSRSIGQLWWQHRSHKVGLPEHIAKIAQNRIARTFSLCFQPIASDNFNTVKG